MCPPISWSTSDAAEQPAVPGVAKPHTLPPERTWGNQLIWFGGGAIANTLEISAPGVRRTVLDMRVEHHELVRDRIPEIIRERGGVAATRVLDEREYLPALLVEQARAAGPVELPGEIADLEHAIDPGQ